MTLASISDEARETPDVRPREDRPAEGKIARRCLNRLVCIKSASEPTLHADLHPYLRPRRGLRCTQVFLATAHLDHDPTNNCRKNSKAFCQRCHMLNDRSEHQRRWWLTLHRRKAMGDLFLGLYHVGSMF